ncbi:23S rRNA (uridine(2552)-2'-O-)-methyltransferase [Vittaforma corneae ATCC 50505]|uniref:23S rRNA (Uridine(2552)-2'-O-)-methyltransferase n=1 Tax=Vittaforma corneae (strain ATCC 50505) TaxID=993615 RepID=L2GL09_VITCO|nr:23S rRNA (uridine(2552)-2'-O-)-methyltransferase [Vittaforma corneae ATCC 50505]ELA41541.1 23S rRNA (uridine(2552)-2'-O-)-methyltransferase [Vittaforma corneae ATCC 50505]
MAVRKQRLDKYYNLAKEKGYRARSAFKLLELNRKYNFLSNTNIAVDLCAAPGGWMQILAQEMPSPRKIIGIDLDPIKPLGSDTISFVGDITTADCRRTLIRYLEGHQVDIFVHDGAPSFGSSKDRDIFIQNDLVLHALKLATEFLKEGGAFVTKIFRSENFFKITKVLEELFVQVDITKPMSSRSESAEIFAVCRRFRNPEAIDPSIFNSEVLFYDETVDKEKNKRMLLSDFIKDKSNKILKECTNVIVDFDCDLITEEYREMFKDIKLLHDTDLKKISKLKAKIVKGVGSGTYDIPILSELVIADEKNNTQDRVLTDAEKIDEINKKLEENRKAKKLKSLSLITTARDGFFNDRIFEGFDSSEGSVEEIADKQVEGEILVESSCSDSMEFTESELQCAIMMKNMGDKFIETTVDKNIIDSDDIVLPCEQRPCKFDEFNQVPKKVREYVNRKRARALRRAKKAMDEIEVEDEEEEAVIYKKVFKNMCKKAEESAETTFPEKTG